METKDYLEILNEIIPLPDGYYYGVNEQDNLKITLFKEDATMPNKMGEAIETFIIDDYSTEELLEFFEELKDYMKD